MQTMTLGTADAVYEEIKRRIIALEFQPGEKLSEARLASSLCVNRSPLRTALARLQADGWLTVSPQSGTYVRDLTGKEMTEVLEFRLLLETHVTGIAAERISEEALERLTRAFDAFGTTTTKENIDAYVALDQQLHLAIYEAAGNSLVRQTLLDLIDRALWIRRRTSQWPERNHESLLEAREILDALKARDSARAVEAMRVHITNIIAFHRDAAPSTPKSAASAPGARSSSMR